MDEKRKKRNSLDQPCSSMLFRELYAISRIKSARARYFLSVDLPKSQDASKHSCGRFRRHSVYLANMLGRSPEMRLCRCLRKTCIEHGIIFGHGRTVCPAYEQAINRRETFPRNATGNGNREMDRERTIPGQIVCLNLMTSRHSPGRIPRAGNRIGELSDDSRMSNVIN